MINDDWIKLMLFLCTILPDLQYFQYVICTLKSTKEVDTFVPIEYISHFTFHPYGFGGKIAVVILSPCITLKLSFRVTVFSCEWVDVTKLSKNTCYWFHPLRFAGSTFSLHRQAHLRRWDFPRCPTLLSASARYPEVQRVVTLKAFLLLSCLGTRWWHLVDRGRSSPHETIGWGCRTL